VEYTVQFCSQTPRRKEQPGEGQLGVCFPLPVLESLMLKFALLMLFDKFQVKASSWINLPTLTLKLESNLQKWQ
jgi:hypothetical protein